MEREKQSREIVALPRKKGHELWGYHWILTFPDPALGSRRGGLPSDPGMSSGIVRSGTPR